MRRIRETLFKLIVIVGVCKPLEAIFDIDAATPPEDKDYTFSRSECTIYQTCSKNANDDVERDGSVMMRTRSVVLHGWIGSIRTTCRVSTMCWHRREILVRDCSHRTFFPTADIQSDWTSKEITYGLYLSDHSILNDVETELTVLSGIMIQNLPRETAWHLRGTRRIGVSKEDVETIQQCVCAQKKWIA
jgi:hypothetical protein